MRWLLLVCALVGAVAVATDASVHAPVAVVPIEEGEVFLEESTSVGYSCKQGFKCPIVDGVCCPNGMSCCPDRCVAKNETVFECKPSDARVAERKLYEVFMRKHMLDQQEDHMAKEQENHERELIAEMKRKNEKALFNAKVSYNKLKAKQQIDKQKKKVLGKLKKLAEKSGQPLNSLVPQSVVETLGLQKEVKPCKDQACKDAQKQHLEHAKELNEAKQEKKDHDKHTQLNPTGGWSNYGSYYDVLRVQKWRHICFLSGMVRGEGKKVAVVPEACRPRGGRVTFGTLRNNKPARLDILPNGEVLLMDAATADNEASKKANYLSLSGVSYDVNNGTVTFLNNGWHNYNNGWVDTYTTKIGDMCMMTGLIRSGKWTQIGEVPKDCAPEKTVILSANCNKNNVRVDINPNRTIEFAPGAERKGQEWASLSNIVYARRPGKPLELKNKWTNHIIKGNSGPKYRAASFTRVGNMVLLSGLVKPGEGGHIGTLPGGFRPLNRLVFQTNHGNGMTRVDVTVDGHIIYVAGRVFNWVVLDGIQFFAFRTDKNMVKQEEAAYDAEEAHRLGRKPDADKGRILEGLQPAKGETEGDVLKAKNFHQQQQRQALVDELKQMAARTEKGHLKDVAKTSAQKVHTKSTTAEKKKAAKKAEKKKKAKRKAEKRKEKKEQAKAKEHRKKKEEKREERKAKKPEENKQERLEDREKRAALKEEKEAQKDEKKAEEKKTDNKDDPNNDDDSDDANQILKAAEKHEEHVLKEEREEKVEKVETTEEHQE